MRSRASLALTSLVLLAALAAAQRPHPVGGNPSGSNPIPLGGEGGPSHGGDSGGNTLGGSNGFETGPDGSNPSAPRGIGTRSGSGSGPTDGGAARPTSAPRAPGLGGAGARSYNVRAGTRRGKKMSATASLALFNIL